MHFQKCQYNVNKRKPPQQAIHITDWETEKKQDVALVAIKKLHQCNKIAQCFYPWLKRT